jgi:hypothetical protein
MSAAARKPETLSPWTVGRPVSFDRSARAPGDAHLPSLSKERIVWRTNGAVVQIFVDLINTNDHATTPAFLFVEAAALGAFVPGWSVAKIPVPAMSPGERLRVESSVARSALPSTDLARTARVGGFGPTFPPPGLDLLTPPEWVGNLNVWFDVAREQAVEVHRALDLRVAAGSLGRLRAPQRGRVPSRSGVHGRGLDGRDRSCRPTVRRVCRRPHAGRRAAGCRQPMGYSAVRRPPGVGGVGVSVRRGAERAARLRARVARQVRGRARALRQGLRADRISTLLTSTLARWKSLSKCPKN